MLAVEDRALPLELVDHQSAEPAATKWKPSESCRESKQDNQTTRLQDLHVKHAARALMNAALRRGATEKNSLFAHF